MFSIVGGKRRHSSKSHPTKQMFGRVFVVMTRDPVAAARWLIRRHGLELPMKPALIAQRLGIDVVFRPLSHRTSGCLIPEHADRGPTEYLIVVNSRHSKERQAFTIAHELGHWTMHRYMRRNFVCRPWPNNQLDIEANIFAAELLMPASVVRRLAPHMSFTSLAGLFGVSLTAMHWRLEELQLDCA